MPRENWGDYFCRETSRRIARPCEFSHVLNTCCLMPFSGGAVASFPWQEERREWEKSGKRGHLSLPKIAIEKESLRFPSTSQSANRKFCCRSRRRGNRSISEKKPHLCKPFRLQFYGRKWLHQFYGRLGFFGSFCRNLHAHEIPRFAGGYFGFWWGRGEGANFILWARGIFLGSGKEIARLSLPRFQNRSAFRIM